MTNWNNTVVKGFGAADDQWGRSGSAARVDLLDKNLARLRDGGKKNGKWSLASLTAAMNAAGPRTCGRSTPCRCWSELLKGSQAPSARAQQMLDLMSAWSNAGGSRLDRDGDGKIDNPGAAVMDGSWTNIANAFLQPRLGTQLDELNTLFSRFDLPPSGQYSGWYQYFERDINSLLGEKVKDPFTLELLRQGQPEGLPERRSGERSTPPGRRSPPLRGTEDPAAWRSDALREQIKFSPLNIKTMRYTNRPSGIQQVISFDGHRPKKKNKK